MLLHFYVTRTVLSKKSAVALNWTETIIVCRFFLKSAYNGAIMSGAKKELPIPDAQREGMEALLPVYFEKRMRLPEHPNRKNRRMEA